jgi:D-alanyl-lipoteichoic acid acyltransferase DltB (MBOAT superfamily)
VAANLIGGGKKYKQFYLITCIVLNLAILFFFKYYHFAAENITALMQLFGVQLHIPEMNVLLPVGISFYIFQALGYSIDVYRGDVEPEKNFFNYALFVSFFPQLVAGPIERSTNLLQQFKTKHSFDDDLAISGVNLMLWGYFLKLVMADRCAIYVDSVFDTLEYQEGGSCLLASIFFSTQIYGDFAGYSFIAIGCSRVMGFRLMDNFRRPYFSISVSDFWRRWHISLSQWLRDYVYIPLGGSRKCNTRTYINLMITFLISGFWHGANWTYVIWGLLHGMVLCIERLFKINKTISHGFVRCIRILITFFVVNLIWIFFRADSIKEAVCCISKIFTHPLSLNTLDKTQTFYVVIAILVVLFTEYNAEFRHVRLSSDKTLLRYSLSSIFLLAGILLLGVFNGAQFIYFQF